MYSPPLIAAELKWAGFDMLAHANNHAFDYGSFGVLETIQHVETEGLVIAGSGKDLHQARAPRYFHCRGATVALIAMASDFVRYGSASCSRHDVAGRPGINPLAIRRRQIRMMPLRASGRRANLISRLFPRAISNFPKLEVVLHWEQVRRANRPGGQPRGHFGGRRQRRHCRSVDPCPPTRALRRLPGKLSTEAHTRCWFTALIRFAVSSFTEVDRFFTRSETSCSSWNTSRDFRLRRINAWALPPMLLSTCSEKLRAKHMSGLLGEREVFELVVAIITFTNDRLSRLRLMPIELNFDSKDGSRGRPRLASLEMGKRIIGAVARRSSRFKTPIRYDQVDNIGEVVLS